MAITTVIISSTAQDLPKHKKAVEDVCLRMGLSPQVMDVRPAEPCSPAEASVAMVDRSDVYVLIVGWRRGSSPPGSDKSFTEIEYDRAQARKIPRLVFLMHEEHPLTVQQVESQQMERLQAFRKTLELQNRAAYFKSPEELGMLALHALSELRDATFSTGEEASPVPVPPFPYVCHRYTLMGRAADLVGRTQEMEDLSAWAANPEAPAVLTIVDIGGAGKSALAWTWFSISTQPPRLFGASLWWSFFEEGATYEAFVDHALAYLTGSSLPEVRTISISDRASRLLDNLRRQAVLIVVDGLERVLNAFAGIRGAFADDNEGRIAESDVEWRASRDPRIDRFLQQATKLQRSKLLITSRLYPSALENDGRNIHGTFRFKLPPLRRKDAATLLQSLGLPSDFERALDMFSPSGFHPLIMKMWALDIINDRRTPGDVNAWLDRHPEFNPLGVTDGKLQGYVIDIVLSGLSERESQLLRVIAPFRSPVAYDTIVALLARGSGWLEQDVIEALQALETRAFLGWDSRPGHNRYDLHPVVRGAIWGALPATTRQNIHELVHAHFAAVPSVAEESVQSMQQLQPVLELYYSLIGLGRYDDAYQLFSERLRRPLWYKFGASHELADTLVALFDKPGQMAIGLPNVGGRGAPGAVLDALGSSYELMGKPGRAKSYYQQAHNVLADAAGPLEVNIRQNMLCHYAGVLQMCGELKKSTEIATEALTLADATGDGLWRALTLRTLGRVAIACGQQDADDILDHAARLIKEESAKGMFPLKRPGITLSSAEHFGHMIAAFRAQWAIHRLDGNAAHRHAHEASHLAVASGYERDLIHAKHLEGEAARLKGDLAKSRADLEQALARARAINFVEVMVQSLIALAEIDYTHGAYSSARLRLEEASEYSTTGPFPMFEADVWNAMGLIELRLGNLAASHEAVERARQSARCDGPPYAYAHGLLKAEHLSNELAKARR